MWRRHFYVCIFALHKPIRNPVQIINIPIEFPLSKKKIFAFFFEFEFILMLGAFTLKVFTLNERKSVTRPVYIFPKTREDELRNHSNFILKVPKIALVIRMIHCEYDWGSIHTYHIATVSSTCH